MEKEINDRLDLIIDSSAQTYASSIIKDVLTAQQKNYRLQCGVVLFIFVGLMSFAFHLNSNLSKMLELIYSMEYNQETVTTYTDNVNMESEASNGNIFQSGENAVYNQNAGN